MFRGAEPLVIAGARNTLARYAPIIFTEIFEEGLKGIGSSVADYLTLLAECGYEPYFVKDGKVDKPASFDEIIGRMQAKRIS